MSLFQGGAFTLHSGQKTNFKIDCDALTDKDWDTLASLISKWAKFGKVVGVPRGGLKLAKALEKYEESHTFTLIVDDVLTTGASMEGIRRIIGGPSFGIVVFSRGTCPFWVTPIFQMLLPKGLL